MIALDQIRIDGGTQSRTELNQEVVAEYAEAYRAGVQMPPVMLFFDGAEFWLADGFHRFFGAKAAGLTEIYDERQPGTQRDAVLFSLSANAKHGLRRSNADKRKAVQTLLADSEWATWSNNEIAKRCGVGDHLVADVKKALTSFSRSGESNSRTYTTKHGTTATMNTANIGAKPTQQPVTKSEDEPDHQQPKVTEIDGLREHNTEQGETIKELLAENESLAKVFESNDQLAAALAEAKKCREMNRILEERIRGLMNEKSEAIRSAKSWMRRAEKAESSLKEIGYAN